MKYRNFWAYLLTNLTIGLFYVNTQAQGILLNIKEGERQAILPMKTESEIMQLAPADGYFVFNITTGCVNYFFKQGWRSLCGSCLPSPSLPVIDSIVATDSKTKIYFKETGDTVSVTVSDRRFQTVSSPLSIFVTSKEKEVKGVFQLCNKCGCKDTVLVLPTNGRYVSEVEILVLDGRSYKTRVMGANRWMCEDYIPAGVKSVVNDKSQFLNIQQTSCPSGWRVPSSRDWSYLLQYYEDNLSDIFLPATNENISIQLAKNGAYAVKEKQMVAAGEMGIYWTSDFNNGKQRFINITDMGFLMPEEKPELVAIPVRCIKNEK